MATETAEIKRAYKMMLRKYPDVLNVQQLAEILSVSSKTCYKLLQDGQIEAFRIGKIHRISKTKAFKYILTLELENC